MIPALLWKEWREQRWRMILSVFVLATISASLVRAQLIPTPEAILLSFGVLGLILTIFLSMGSVATERQDGTWPFTLSQPIPRPTILRVKWLIGALNLLIALLFSGLAVTWAAWSRNLYALDGPPAWLTERVSIITDNPNSALWTWRIIVLSCVSLLSLFTVLFFLLTRARNELHAGLGGILLTFIILAWLLQYLSVRHTGGAFGGLHAWEKAFWYSALINPLSPIAFMFESLRVQACAVTLSVTLWTILPLTLIGAADRRRTRR